MPQTDTIPFSNRLRLIFRRLLHSFAFLVATLATLAVFVLVLVLAESVVYALTGQPVSTLSMVIAAIAVAFGYAPLIEALQKALDRIFFKEQLDMLAAIRQLGTGDLAWLPIQDVEPALLQRICGVSHRSFAALDERGLANGALHTYPADAPPPPQDEQGDIRPYELRLKLPLEGGEAYLWLGPRNDGWPLDSEEREALASIARFAAMSLEHARLAHRQSEAARLDSLSRVTKQLHSHDLKNRLHDLSFLAHHLRSGKLDEEDIQRLVDAIRKVTARMQTLMQRMTDPRAPLDPNIAPLDLAALVRMSIENRLWPESVQIEQHIAPLPPVAGDEELLRGVLENLYDNAVQAMQGKGVLKVATRLSELDGRPCAEVSVQDNGIGIPEDFLKRKLFGLFATSKANGLGVGLYLCRRIMLAHGGTIAAESAGLGKGATFTLKLPLWRECDDADKAQTQAMASEEA